MSLKMFVIGLGFAASALLTGCGSVETGQVGVRTTVSGEVQQAEVQQGFYTALLSSVDKYSVKQIPVVLTDMKPKAADNLRLSDLDVTVYYTVNPSSVADMQIKYSNATAWDENKVGFPAYNIVVGVARSETATAVSKFNSMELNDKRNELEADIKARIQAELDRTDKGVFVIDRINVTNILPDPTVEKSIQAVVTSENRKRQAQNELEVAKVESETLRVRSQALDGKVLEDKKLDVMMEMAKSNNKVFVIDSKTNATLMMQ